MLMKKLYLLLRECVLCGGGGARGQETRMNGMMMSGKVLCHDFVTRGHDTPINSYGVGGAVKTGEDCPGGTFDNSPAFSTPGNVGKRIPCR